jgi:hypothetical protein
VIVIARSPLQWDFIEVPADGIDAAATLNKQLGDFHSVVDRCPVQQCASVRIHPKDTLITFCYFILQLLDISILHRLHQLLVEHCIDCTNRKDTRLDASRDATLKICTNASALLSTVLENATSLPRY